MTNLNPVAYPLSARYHLPRWRVALWFLAMFLLIGMPIPSFGQYVDHSFERVLTNEGLSKGTIHSIIQDRYGFLWLGTADLPPFYVPT